MAPKSTAVFFVEVLFTLGPSESLPGQVSMESGEDSIQVDMPASWDQRQPPSLEQVQQLFVEVFDYGLPTRGSHVFQLRLADEALSIVIGPARKGKGKGKGNDYRPY